MGVPFMVPEYFVLAVTSMSFLTTCSLGRLHAKRDARRTNPMLRSKKLLADITLRFIFVSSVLAESYLRIPLRTVGQEASDFR